MAEPRIKASMYFAYGDDARAGLASKTTFEAILRGERTSTTRFPEWPGHERWRAVGVGDTVRFFCDRAMRGRHVDVVVTGKADIDLARCGEDEIEAWSRAEGWSAAAGRRFGDRHQAGIQIHYALAEREAP